MSHDIPSLCTHEALDRELCGHVTALGEGSAVVELKTTKRMAADDHGLVHGGFVFGLADHAAMTAVNHPNVVLGGANIRFERPVTIGENLVAYANLREIIGKKHIVYVEVHREQTLIMRGEFICFCSENHVLASPREEEA